MLFGCCIQIKYANNFGRERESEEKTGANGTIGASFLPDRPNAMLIAIILCLNCLFALIYCRLMIEKWAQKYSLFWLMMVAL